MNCALSIKNVETNEWEPVRTIIGPPGPKGPKPEVGVDYFTDTDKDEIISRLRQELDDLMNGLYYKPGDTVKIHVHTAGILTSDRKRVYFSIPLDKPLKGVKSVTYSNPTAQIRQDGVYLLGSGSASDGWQWSSNLSLVIDVTNFPVSAAVCYPSDGTNYFNGINNETIGVSLDCTLTFE